LQSLPELISHYQKADKKTTGLPYTLTPKIGVRGEERRPRLYIFT
jgi:hypothetical protein